MRFLLDENLNWRLERYLPDHAVESVQKNDLRTLKNGELLSRAQGRFDAFITLDRNIGSQQKISQYTLVVVALRARSSRLRDTWPLMAEVMKQLPHLKPGTITHIG